MARSEPPPSARRCEGLQDALQRDGSGSLLRSLGPREACRLRRAAPGLRGALPPEVVRAACSTLLASGAFGRPWAPGAPLAEALRACAREDVDACFALLAALQVGGACGGGAEAAADAAAPKAAARRSWPALHVAASRDFAATARLLLEAGAAELQRRDACDGLAAVDVAIVSGSARAAAALLDLGARPSQAQDALLVAVGQGEAAPAAALARRLAAEGLADVDSTIDLAMEYEDAEVVVRLLAFPEASKRPWVPQWALRHGACRGLCDIVDQVLKLPGVHPDDGAETAVGPALVLAAEAGHEGVCWRLLLYRADANAARRGLEERCTAADLAARRGHRAVLQVLAEAADMPKAPSQ